MDEREPIAERELEKANAEELPAREALSVITPAVDPPFVDLELGTEPPPADTDAAA